MVLVPVREILYFSFQMPTSNLLAELLTRLLSLRLEIGGPIGTIRGNTGFRADNLKIRRRLILHKQLVNGGSEF